MGFPYASRTLQTSRRADEADGFEDGLTEGLGVGEGERGHAIGGKGLDTGIADLRTDAQLDRLGDPHGVLAGLRLHPADHAHGPSHLDGQIEGDGASSFGLADLGGKGALHATPGQEKSFASTPVEHTPLGRLGAGKEMDAVARRDLGCGGVLGRTLQHGGFLAESYIGRRRAHLDGVPLRARASRTSLAAARCARGSAPAEPRLLPSEP